MKRAPRRIAISDIDGCLVDYPNVFLEWVAQNRGLRFETLEAMKASMTRDEYDVHKLAYRKSGVKRTLPLREDALALFESLKKRDFDVWIVTSRPPYEFVMEDTRHWLDANGVPYDCLVFTHDKREVLRKAAAAGLRFIIDDDHDIVHYAATELGLPAFYFFHGERNGLHERIRTVRAWRGVQDGVEQLAG